MNKTIYDAIEEENNTDSEIDEIDEISLFEPGKKALKNLQEFQKSSLKGLIEGVGRLGRSFGPLESDEGKTTPQYLEEQTEALEELIPTEEEGFIQRGTRRGLRELPSMLSFPGSGAQTATRTMLGGFFGEAAKDLGAPEWAQSAAEITAHLGPDLTKKLIESGKNKDIIKAGRDLGFSDEAITPLIQSDFKKKWLSKITPARGRTSRSLKSTQGELQNVYKSLENSEVAKKSLPKNLQQKFNEKIDKFLRKIPDTDRKKITEDLKILREDGLTGENLINFYYKINQIFGKRSPKILRNIIKDSIKSIDSGLAKDFDLVNDLYVKYYDILSKLEPTLSSDIYGAAENIGLLGSIVTGYYPAIVKFVGDKVGRNIAREMLINPRFQQLGQKTLKAIQANKPQLVKKLINMYADEMKKIDKDLSEEIRDISPEEFKKLFT